MDNCACVYDEGWVWGARNKIFQDVIVILPLCTWFTHFLLYDQRISNHLYEFKCVSHHISYCVKCKLRLPCDLTLIFAPSAFVHLTSVNIDSVCCCDTVIKSNAECIQQSLIVCVYIARHTMFKEYLKLSIKHANFNCVNQSRQIIMFWYCYSLQL